MDKKKNIEKKLTAKEEKFCREYVLHLNATKAAINAGYSKRTAAEIGYENLTKPHIKSRVAYLKENLGEASEISALKVIKEHAKIAFMDVGDIREDWVTLKNFNDLTPDQRACIKEVSSRTTRGRTEDGEPTTEDWVKITLHDKQKALESLSKMLGYDAPTKLALTDKNGNDVALKVEVINDKAKEELAKLEEKLK